MFTKGVLTAGRDVCSGCIFPGQLNGLVILTYRQDDDSERNRVKGCNMVQVVAQGGGPKGGTRKLVALGGGTKGKTGYVVAQELLMWWLTACSWAR